MVWQRYNALITSCMPDLLDSIVSAYIRSPYFSEVKIYFIFMSLD